MANMERNITPNTEELNAIIIYNFLKEFNQLEFFIKNLFSDTFNSIDKASLKNELLFFSGVNGYKNTVYFDTNEISLKVAPLSYSNKSIKTNFTMTQIIKLHVKLNFLPELNLNVESKKVKMIEFSIHDCCKSFIEMRNKLSHELSSFSFKSKHVVEQLTIKKILEEKIPWIERLNLESINDYGINILSNYIYIVTVINMLKQTGGINVQKMDN